MASRSHHNQAVATLPRYRIAGVAYRTPAEASRWFACGAWSDALAGDLPRVASERWGGRAAIVSQGRQVSYAEFDELSERLGAALLSSGLNPSDRVLFQMGTSIATAVCLFACFKAGLVPVCSIPQFRAHELTALARMTDAAAHLVQSDASQTFDLVTFGQQLLCDLPMLKCFFFGNGTLDSTSGTLEALIEAMPLARARRILRDVAIGAQDVMKFQLSGGSTGLPKIIPRFHAEYLPHSLDWARQFGRSETSVSLWSLPLVHNGGQVWALFPTFLVGSTLVLCDNDIDVIFDAIERHGVTHAMTIGPIAPKILSHPAIPHEKLRTLAIFGNMNRAEALEQALGVPCANVYGITEGIISITPPASPAWLRHDTNGTPASAFNDLKLLHPGTEDEVKTGGIGELCFKGPSSLVSYFGDDAANRSAFTSNGYFRTGDLVRLVRHEAQPFIVFEGRAKDNIDRGGEKFGVEDIEVLIGGHPDIADGRVVAIPDPLMGERACAFLVMKPGCNAPSVAELGAFLGQRGLAKFKWPERIEPIAALPVTGVGKLDRNALRALAQALSTPPKGAQPEGISK